MVLNYDFFFRFLGTNLKWGLIKYPRMRLKRNVLFGFTDVLGKYSKMEKKYQIIISY